MQRNSLLSPWGCEPIQMVSPAKAYGPSDYYEPLRSGPVVHPAGMTTSAPCREPVFGPSRHRCASYTMATLLPRDQKPAQVAERGEGGGEEGRGGGGG